MTFLRHIKSSDKSMALTDLGVAAAFVGAIAVLLMVGGYVISRFTLAKAYAAKWKDYDDCGWA